MPKALDIAGKRFGRLVVIKRVMVRGAKNVMWRCICDCGGSIVVAASNLNIGGTKSCGCLAQESAANLLRGNTNNRTHHKSQSTEYNSWSSMKQRCLNPNCHKYPIYGGRGIRVCDRWLNSFEKFLADMGPKPPGTSLHRVENDGNYEPDNCVWAPPQVQGRNTRQARFIKIDGETKCLIEWCEHIKIPVWKIRESVRGRGSKRDLPPLFTSVEEAVFHFYNQRIIETA